MSVSPLAQLAADVVADQFTDGDTVLDSFQTDILRRNMSLSVLMGSDLFDFEEVDRRVAILGNDWLAEALDKPLVHGRDLINSLSRHIVVAVLYESDYDDGFAYFLRKEVYGYLSSNPDKLPEPLRDLAEKRIRKLFEERHRFEERYRRRLPQRGQANIAVSGPDHPGLAKFRK